jgi:sugar lactone lactonase YvrE
MPDYICWLIARRDGDGFMAGLRDGIARVWLEPECASNTCTSVCRRQRPAHERRQGDSAGRIWAGSMHNTDYAQAAGTLFRWRPTRAERGR